MNRPWYWQLGFSTNPFSIKPAALTSNIIAHKLECIIKKIDDGETQFIEAPLGSGKTTILKSIIATFGGSKKVIYVNCIKTESLDIEGLLKNSSLKGRLFGSIPTEMILLVDEAQSISSKDAEDITKFVREGNIKSVAFFGIHYQKKQFTKEINDALEGNVAVLSYLSPDHAVELVRARIGNLKLLPDYVIRELYGRSSGNPRRLLQYCEDICRKAAELSITELTINDVAALIKSPSLNAQKQKKARKPAMKRKRKARKKVEPEIANVRTYEEEMGNPANPVID